VIERVKDYLRKPSTGIFLVLVVLTVLFQTGNPDFLSKGNIEAILRSLSYTGIIAIGMGLCLISGVIDLSAGATSALASVLFSKAMVEWGVSLPLSIGLALLTGALVGLVNAFIIIKLKVTPFIATIASQFMVRGLALAWTRGFIVYPLPAGIGEIGMLRPLGVSVGFLILLAVAGGAYYLLNHTVLGLEIKATGSDYEIAKITEVRYVLVHVFVLTLVGVLSALAGVLLSFVLNGGTPNVGIGWEFTAITACAIGGVSLMGYEGSIEGILIGLLVVYVLQNGVVVIGVSVFMQNVVIGLVLLVAVVLDVRRRKYLNIESL